MRNFNIRYILIKKDSNEPYPIHGYYNNDPLIPCQALEKLKQLESEHDAGETENIRFIFYLEPDNKLDRVPFLEDCLTIPPSTIATQLAKEYLENNN